MFGYRGVVLFSWVGDVFDRDNGIQIRLVGREKEREREGRRSFYYLYHSRSQWEEEGSKIEKIKELQPDRHIFYQTLVDQRDYKMMVQQHHVSVMDYILCIM